MQFLAKRPYLILLLAGYLISCGAPQREKAATQSGPQMQSQPFGFLPDGTPVTEYVLRNEHGMTVHILDYGATITRLLVPDRDGVFQDVVLGFDSIADYLDRSPYFGSVIGRYGNRIANGHIILDSIPYTLAKNNGANHLHGGLRGFDKVRWEATLQESDLGPGLLLTYNSPHMEEGYPGNLNVSVQYSLTKSNDLVIDYVATTDRPTVINLTQHSYFNLSGTTSPILDHTLQLNARRYLPVDSTLIPLGEEEETVGTPFDFLTAKEIRQDIGQSHEQLMRGGGYDHCFVLDNWERGALRQAGTLSHPESGRIMEIFTTEPGIQLYTGNFLNGVKGKGSSTYGYRSGICLETQHFPDSPNQPQFPSTVLRPDQTYNSSTIYAFRTDGETD